MSSQERAVAVVDDDPAVCDSTRVPMTLMYAPIRAVPISSATVPASPASSSTTGCRDSRVDVIVSCLKHLLFWIESHFLGSGVP
jgi:hypothetical protein